MALKINRVTKTLFSQSIFFLKFSGAFSYKLGFFHKSRGKIRPENRQFTTIKQIKSTKTSQFLQPIG